LLGILHFRCQENARRMSEDRATLLREFRNRVRKALFLEKLQLCRTLAPGRINPSQLELNGVRPHGIRPAAPALPHAFKITLNCENPNFHFAAPNLLTIRA